MECLEDKTANTTQDHRPAWISQSIDVERVIDSFSKLTGPDMESFSCEEALNCLFAIYEVSHESSYFSSAKREYVAT